jgi:hypothetical protein
MHLILWSHYTCGFCLTESRGMYSNGFRVNKNGLRSEGVALVFGPRPCPVCCCPVQVFDGLTVDEKYLPKVNAARLKRGWEPWPADGKVAA